ncbi:hypothetical protein [Paraliobacillus ryukyuensis]|uniref:hypothetical protein n=1 Tax=Paraliobacillus ryukyuensis TaxID=200904 RepID=UPI0009A77740|nr:hypothetical protein [Paraliobacillus ryukyuensis]
MDCLKASDLPVENWLGFFNHQYPANVTEDLIQAYGYFIKSDKLQAFFVLLPIGERSVQLKHLYIKDKLAPVYVLAIIEICIQLVKKKHFDHLYVYSEQDTLNQLVQQLQFEISEESFTYQQSNGTWWSLAVNNNKVY